MTDPTLTRIAQNEHLDPAFILPLDGGQINAIYAYQDALILRLARTPEDSQRLSEEAKLLRYIREQSGGSIPVPEILALGEQDGRAYQIQRRLPGEKLHRLWPDLGTGQKERIMEQVGACLESLHSLRFDNFGWFRTPEITYPDWPGYVEQSYRLAIQIIARHSKGFSAPLVSAANQFLDERLPLLAGSTPVLVHADLWPGNLLATIDGLTAILDFEFAHRAPRDYELVLIEDFCLYPNDFVEPSFRTCSSADYADFFQLLVRHTPGLFAIPHLRQRLDLYHVLFNLQLYAGWCEENQGAEEGAYLLAKLARISNMIFSHGARMFN